MSGTVLVLNSGSSSLKYQLVAPDTGESITHGIVERIGEEGGVADHKAALRAAFDRIVPPGRQLDSLGLVAVGHRVVHGGSTFHRPTVIDDTVSVLPAEGDLQMLKREAMASPRHSVERTYWATWHDQMLIAVDLMNHECRDEIVFWPLTGTAS